MREPALRASLLASFVVTLAFATGCPPGGPAAEGEAGEGEGAGAGEGEGAGAGEGEGEGAGAGEGEGAGAGEGEGAGAGEGEGAGAGEGEGAGGEGEGVGTGDGAIGDSCSNDSFCQAGLACGFSADGPALATTCVTAPTTGSPVGTPCQDAGQCAFGLCQDNLCSAPCLANNDCAVGQKCQNVSTTVPGVAGGVVKVCILDGDAPQTACQDNGDCAPSNQVCDGIVADANQDETFVCGFAGAGTGEIGDPCDTASLQNSADCHTGLCDDSGAHGICTAACDANNDCGGNFICTGSGFTNVLSNICEEICAKEADCTGAGRACKLRENLARNVLDEVCGAEGTGAVNPPGFKTNDSGVCQTGFTISSTVNAATVSYCSALCTADAANSPDCPFTANDGTHVAITSCASVDFVLPNAPNNTDCDTNPGDCQTVHVCVTP